MRTSEAVDHSTKSHLVTPVVAGLFLSACLFATRVSAIPLAPGGTDPAIAEPNPVGGTVLASTTDGFTSSALNGTVTSTVIQNDPASPFGPGNLTFTYLITMNNSPQDLSAFSVGSYGGYLVDVGYQGPPPAGTPPTQIIRSSGFGDTITFQWMNAGGLGTNAMSALLVIATDATQYHVASGGVIDDTPVDLNNLLAPVSLPAQVPDSTGTATLLAAGMGALFVFRRCQSQPAMAAI